MFYESQLHSENCFVTLTYSEDNVPALGSLEPADTTLWLKKLRRAVEPRRFRYFLCGEYGDESGRPHYHACLFGIGINDSAAIDRAWGLGFTATAEFNDTTAAYVAGYVVKKMTAKDDPRLEGRYPEFSRMSNRPGLGAGAMELLAPSLTGGPGLAERQLLGDVPSTLRMGRRSLPLGRYLRQKLREAVGMTESEIEEAKGKAFYERSIEVSELQILSRAHAQTLEEKSRTAKQVILAKDQGRIWSVESKYKLQQSKGKKL